MAAYLCSMNIYMKLKHIPKDLAGWHVCLDVIEALLDGKSIKDRVAIWKAYYPKYQQTVKDAEAGMLIFTCQLPTFKTTYFLDVG